MPRIGRPPLYPWNVWLDGQERFLQPAIDFRSSVIVTNLRSQVYAEAAKRGRKVSCQLYADGLVVKAGDDASAPRAPGRRETRDWDSIFCGDPVTLRNGRDFRGGIRGAITLRAAAYAAAKRRGLKIRTMLSGDNRRAQITIVANVGSPDEEETFPPPVIVDEGIDEDTVFPLRDWDGNIIEEPKREEESKPLGSAYVTVAEMQARLGIVPSTPAPQPRDDDELPDLDRVVQWDEPTSEEIAEAERLAIEHG